MTDRQTKESVDKNFTVMFILREINSHRFFRWKFNSHTTPHVCLLVCRSVCWSVCHNYLKGRDVSYFFRLFWIDPDLDCYLFINIQLHHSYLFIHLSIYLYIYQSINLSICQSIYVDMVHVNQNITVSKEIERKGNICTLNDMAKIFSVLNLLCPLLKSR